MGSMAIAFLVVVAMAAPVVLAETYTVGGADGWELSTDFPAWLSGKIFVVGDILEFKYGASHSVAEVKEGDYSKCISANPIESHGGTATTIELTEVGTRYFICPTSNHCSSGMALKIVVGASTSPTTTDSSPPPPSTSTDDNSNTTTSSPPPPPSTPNAAIKDSLGISVAIATMLIAFVA